jgi:hypothetical protein
MPVTDQLLLAVAVLGIGVLCYVVGMGFLSVSLNQLSLIDVIEKITDKEDNP